MNNNETMNFTTTNLTEIFIQNKKVLCIFFVTLVPIMYALFTMMGWSCWRSGIPDTPENRRILVSKYNSLNFSVTLFRKLHEKFGYRCDPRKTVVFVRNREGKLGHKDIYIAYSLHSGNINENPLLVGPDLLRVNGIFLKNKDNSLYSSFSGYPTYVYFKSEDFENVRKCLNSCMWNAFYMEFTETGVTEIHEDYSRIGLYSHGYSKGTYDSIVRFDNLLYGRE